MTFLEMIIRIMLAMLIGGIIGWERGTSNRPAGLRTHMLVAIGASVIMMIGETSLIRYSNITTMDPTRLGAQVISGIGFLGAGTIMREGVTVKGLTTAASLWAVACLGLAAGGGFYDAAIIGAIAIILTLTIFEYLEKRFMKTKSEGLLLDLECMNVADVICSMNQVALQYDISLKDLEIREVKATKETQYHVTVKLDYNKSKKRTDYEGILAEISAWNSVLSVKSAEYHR